MARFRKKPVVIDAVRVTELLHGDGDLPAWVAAALDADEIQLVPTTNKIYVRTPEGVMRGENADWLIRGVKGELYPCKPDVFEATYEEVLG